MFAFARRNQVLLSSCLCVFLSLSILAAAANGRLRADPVGPLLLALMRPLQIGAHAVVLWVRDIADLSARLGGLASENRQLRERIQDLEAERNRLLEVEATNRRLAELLAFRSQLPSASLTASVIGSSASTWFRSLTLDKGSAHGVVRRMAVVSPAGVVGHVVAVTSRSAKVLLLTDPHSGVDVIVQRSRARGIVGGSLDNGPVMKYVKRSEDVEAGDRLITSGVDGIFPKGLLVGTVAKVRKKSFGLFQFVAVDLAVDPSNIEEVLLVPPQDAPHKEENQP
ncbi:MAG: rod shape-determining protein MreC [Deltaproteobacteria bacterium]|nr:rod shape-determining protein MreC [Deltaproteobacteria bacterium]